MLLPELPQAAILAAILSRYFTAILGAIIIYATH
jgi:hypothetical protein